MYIPGLDVAHHFHCPVLQSDALEVIDLSVETRLEWDFLHLLTLFALNPDYNQLFPYFIFVWTSVPLSIVLPELLPLFIKKINSPSKK